MTINTHRGLYRYTRLPFGIASAPALFQKAMDTILQGIPHTICYLDDILVTGANDVEHLSNLKEVLSRLQRHGVHLKQKKCCFMQDLVDYLGHHVTADGIHVDASKVEALRQAPPPTNVSELRSFLGMLNYYGNFLQNLSTLLHPLNELLKAGQQWNWSHACNEAFEEAKRQLSTAPVLVHYDPDLPICLAGDASSYGIGAVLSHVLADGTEHPIAFASRSLQAAERNYAQIEKEALALIFGIQKFLSTSMGEPSHCSPTTSPSLLSWGRRLGFHPWLRLVSSIGLFCCLRTTTPLSSDRLQLMQMPMGCPNCH